MLSLVVLLPPFSIDVKIDDKPPTSEQAEVTILAEDYLGISSWVDNSLSAGNWYDRSTDTTKTWGTDIAIAGSDCCDPVIRKQGDILHFVWLNWDGIYYMRSLDGGATFSQVISLSGNCFSVDHPWIDVKGNEVAVVWYGCGNVNVSCSKDSGATWTNYVLPGTTNHGIPVITADRNRFYAVFWDFNLNGGNYGVAVSVADSCNLWNTPPSRIAEMHQSVGPNPYPQSIVADGYDKGIDLLARGAYVAYMHTNTGSRSDWRIYIARTSDGSAWDTFMVAPHGDVGTYYMPAIVVDWYGYVHLFYFYRISNKKWVLYHTMSLDGGNTWTSPIQVSDTTFEFVDENDCGGVDFVDYTCWPGHYIDASADRERVYVAWADNRYIGGVGPYFHVYTSFAYIRDLVPTLLEEKLDDRVAYSRGILFIDSDEDTQASIRIYSLNGRLIYSNSTLLRKGRNKLKVELARGTYILKINDRTFKIVGGS